jgi:hypothetical protein
MAVERPPSAIWFILRIRVEQAQIGDDVLFVA